MSNTSRSNKRPLTASINDNLIADGYGLTNVDIQRSVRKMLPEKIRDESLMLVENVYLVEADVNDELRCRICLGVLDKTWTVMACLHRFCCECIHRSLRMDLGSTSNKECPLCRVKLASRRAAVPDPVFDSIITLMNYGRSHAPGSSLVESGVLSGETYTTPSTRSHGRAATTDSGAARSSARTSPLKDTKEYCDIAWFRQSHADNVAKFRSRQKQLQLEILKKDDVSIGQSSTMETMYEFIRLALLPISYLRSAEGAADKTLFALKRPFLRLSAQAKICDIRAYLAMKKVKIANGVIEAMSVMFEDKEHVLDDSLTLREVCMTYWDKQSKFILYYK